MDLAKVNSSTRLLQAVLEGATYDAVAHANGVTRTAVERPIKALVLELIRSVGIPGLNQSSAMFVGKLREHRLAIDQALARYRPVPAPPKPTDPMVLSDEDIHTMMQRVRTRTDTPERDAAMVWILFATGLRPLEVARLVVADYLDADGRVRKRSEVRDDVATSGRARPLYFGSACAREAIDAYLATRLAASAEPDAGSWPARLPYRGLDPDAALFHSAAERAFRIEAVPSVAGERCLCPEIHYAYRKIFRRIGIPGLSAQSARYTVVERLRRRGADEDQIEEILGVRELRHRRKRLGLDELMEQLV
ncbi:site-specific integrase [Pseudorhodoferax soli]|uniref:Phage integrase family protein n=1 Tax=Pseudorhodoferax soli TaxID=545864 RepID=A0A368XF56_9BURK|nr:site-specific integrase [Pseudorhodoferax soli]RCW65127.1 phage integrase family protein [Pseudorhodoferax soli]